MCSKLHFATYDSNFYTHLAHLWALLMFIIMTLLVITTFHKCVCLILYSIGRNTKLLLSITLGAYSTLFLPSPYFLPHLYTVDRNTIVGHIPIVSRCSLLCTHLTDLTAPTPALTSRGSETSCLLIPLKWQWNTSDAYHTLAATGRMVTHPSTSQAHGCLTSFASFEMLKLANEATACVQIIQYVCRYAYMHVCIYVYMCMYVDI